MRSQSSLKDFGHSTVIDGIRKEADRHMVHINFGDVVATRNRWYDLFAPIEVRDDHILRAFVTIKPLAARRLQSWDASVGAGFQIRLGQQKREFIEERALSNRNSVLYRSRG